MDRAPDHFLFRRTARRKAFVLVEVLLSLTILGVACLAFMKSFAYSLNAAQKMEIVTVANYLAEQLMDEFEINPPAEGATAGDFSADYKNFHYKVDLEYVDPNYRGANPPDDVERFFAERTLHIQIIYDDGVITPYSAATVDTAIMGFEKFSSQSKLSYQNY